MSRARKGGMAGTSGMTTGGPGKGAGKPVASTTNLPGDLGMNDKTPARTPAGIAKYADVLTPGGQQNP